MPASLGLVVVVERDVQVRELEALLLEGLGFEVLAADGRAKALRRCGPRTADLVGAALETGGGEDGPALLVALRDLVAGLPALFVCTDPAPHPVAPLQALGSRRCSPNRSTPSGSKRWLRGCSGATDCDRKCRAFAVRDARVAVPTFSAGRRFPGSAAPIGRAKLPRGEGNHSN